MVMDPALLLAPPFPLCTMTLEPTPAAVVAPALIVIGPCSTTIDPDDAALETPLFTVTSPDSWLEAVIRDTSPPLLPAPVVAPL